MLTDVLIYRTSSDGEPHLRNLVLAPYHSDHFGEGGKETDELLIECDASLAKPLADTLFAYKVRRKLSIELACEVDLWSIYPAAKSIDYDFSQIHDIRASELMVVHDPRLLQLGLRLLTTLGAKDFHQVQKYLSHITDADIVEKSNRTYEKFRYQLGVCEGLKDMPGQIAFALEANADRLNGLSFRKGIYCGNDITARNYRKGVQRRIMPIKFNLPAGQTVKNLTKYDIKPESDLCLADGEPVGLLRARNGSYGLASVQMNIFKRRSLIDTDTFQLHHPDSGLTVASWLPFWWRQNFPRIPDGKSDLLTLAEFNNNEIGVRKEIAG
jgi:folate-binding protein YgfZ